MAAAEALRAESRLAFLFVGGGSEFRRVQEFARTRSLGNIVCLPYRPLDELSASLSAADLHVVVMGEPFVGIVHPCKVYNILRVQAPLLYLGPEPSHVTDLLRNAPPSWPPNYFCRHQDVTAVVNAIRSAAVSPDERKELAAANAIKAERPVTNEGLRQFLATLEAAARRK
jgi:hypothetical protein